MGYPVLVLSPIISAFHFDKDSETAPYEQKPKVHMVLGAGHGA